MVPPSPLPFPRRPIPILRPLLILSVAERFPNSHGINIFANLHLLNPFPSYSYKKAWGVGYSPQPSNLRTFQPANTPYPPKSFISNTYKTPHKC
jgi:hypothetical protein